MWGFSTCPAVAYHVMKNQVSQYEGDILMRTELSYCVKAIVSFLVEKRSVVISLLTGVLNIKLTLFRTVFGFFFVSPRPLLVRD